MPMPQPQPQPQPQPHPQPPKLQSHPQKHQQHKPAQQVEIVEKTVFLEQYCEHPDCPHRTNPRMCPLNHCKDRSKIILKLDAGTVVPPWLCMFERIWKEGPNGKPMRCRNDKCYRIHISGRTKYMTKVDDSVHEE